MLFPAAETAASPPSETVAQALTQPPLAPVTLADQALAVQNNLDALQALITTDGANIAGITLPALDATRVIPTIQLTPGQFAADGGVLRLITNSVYDMIMVGATAQQAVTLAGTPNVTQIVVSDSAADITARIDGLISAGHTTDLTLNVTDGTLPLTAGQFSALSAELALFPNALTPNAAPYAIAIDATPANLAVNGFLERGIEAKFTGAAAQYAVQGVGDGMNFTVTDTGTGRSSIDHFFDIAALHFSDGLKFVASQQSMDGTSVASAQVVSLYAAAFGRTPDLGGLAFYETAAMQGLSLGTMAQFFLASPEYQGSHAHDYALTAAGDAQFVADSYENLLHRAPTAGDVQFYQNVIAQMTGEVPGNAQAELKGRSLALLYISQSPEFLGDVQITARHPADAQHFLYLI